MRSAIADDAHLGIECRDRVCGGLDLEPADIVAAEDDLPLQVGEIDPVAVAERHRANPRRCEIDRHRRPQSPHADHEHVRATDALLPLDADLGQQDVPAVAGELIVVHGIAKTAARRSGPRGSVAYRALSFRSLAPFAGPEDPSGDSAPD